MIGFSIRELVRFAVGEVLVRLTSEVILDLLTHIAGAGIAAALFLTHH